MNNHKMMRFLLVTSLILFQTPLIFGQTSLKKIDLGKGEFQVGFQHYTTSDSTRTYQRIYDYNNEVHTRPIPISIWYPSNAKIENGQPISVLNYFEILKEEEEWEYLPNEQLLNWFYYSNTVANQNHLKEQTIAYPNAEFAEGVFPVIIYAPSYHASSIENFALCEFLASHGYIVISSPSRGTETRWMSNDNRKNMETQSRDVAFLIKEIGKFPTANPKQIAVMGFSFGGMANVITQMRNQQIKAIVSLDGTERYQYEVLKKSPFFDRNKFDVPYLHMAQKEIPEQVLKEDEIPAMLNTAFLLYDSITKSKAYQLRFHSLSHSYFSTLGVLFEKRDPRQDASDAEIMESYKWLTVYTLNFLNAFLKKDMSAIQFIENKPLENGVPDGLIDQKKKQAATSIFSFQDFNELASKQNYEQLDELYVTTLEIHPSLILPEGNLNTLGLQLTFNTETAMYGINVLTLATKIYPNSANLYDSLAEAYLFVKNTKMAVLNFEKSLVLNPQNQNAIDRLKQLKR